MKSKVLGSAADAMDGVKDGDVVLIGGFGGIGEPTELIDALLETGRTDLTIVSNNCGTGEVGIALLFKHDRVQRVYASFPAQPGSHHFRRAFDAGTCELVLVPQGTLVERLRAAGAGIPAFYTPTGAGSELAVGKEVRSFGGRDCLLEQPLHGDVALIAGHRADRAGNVRHRLASRNFNPIMAMAARYSVVEVTEVLTDGYIDPDDVHTPGIFIDGVVLRANGPPRATVASLRSRQ